MNENAKSNRAAYVGKLGGEILYGVNKNGKPYGIMRISVNGLSSGQYQFFLTPRDLKFLEENELIAYTL